MNCIANILVIKRNWNQKGTEQKFMDCHFFPCFQPAFAVFWEVLILSPKLNAIPCDLARIRM